MAHSHSSTTAETPAALGYRMPAEWEPHEATWLSWPRREGISFPDSYERVMPAFAQMVDALAESEPVRINVCDQAHEDDVRKIAGTYHAWRGDPTDDRHSREGGNPAPYEDIPGFCKSATLEEIRKHGHVLTPGRYVGAEAAEDDGEPFEDNMKRLVATLREQQAEAAKLDAGIAANLKELGYGG